MLKEHEESVDAEEEHEIEMNAMTTSSPKIQNAKHEWENEEQKVQTAEGNAIGEFGESVHVASRKRTTTNMFGFMRDSSYSNSKFNLNRDIPLTSMFHGLKQETDKKDAPGAAAVVGTGAVCLYQAQLTFQTLGIIFGDIGTSPLYTFSSIFTSPPEETEVIGALSVMIWTILLIVLLKYVVFVLLADDHGEGGTFAIYSLLVRGLKKSIKNEKKFETVTWLFSLLAILGVCSLLSDGIITPAISIMGALEGIRVISPDLGQDVVVGTSCAIIVLLYGIQSLGTSRISFLFSPLMVCYFLGIAITGIINISKAPQVWKAFSPYYAGEYFAQNGFEAWVSLGSVFLTVTGSEALFADVGHFNKLAVRLSWTFFVMPCLFLCYLGQAASLIENPQVFKNVFYMSLPSNAVLPMLIFSVFAAIIASQALISASFSVLSQAQRLQFIPRMSIVHTSVVEEGQVYIPQVNYFYMIVIVLVIIGFQSTSALGHAYGIAVAGDMLITTFFYTAVIVFCFKRHWIFAVSFFLFFGLIDGAFLSANLLKFLSGGWFTVAIAVVVSSIIFLWRWGRVRVVNQQREMSVPDKYVFDIPSTDGEVTSLLKIPTRSLTICYSSTSRDIPATYVHFLRCYPVRPRYLVFVNISAVNVPFVTQHAALSSISDFEHVYRLNLYHGYAEFPPSGKKLATYLIRELSVIQDALSKSDDELMEQVRPVFLIGHDQAVSSPKSSWVHSCLTEAYVMLASVSQSAAGSLRLPQENVLDIRIRVPI